jgi:hypothetical protein
MAIFMETIAFERKLIIIQLLHMGPIVEPELFCIRKASFKVYFHTCKCASKHSRFWVSLIYEFSSFVTDGFQVFFFFILEILEMGQMDPAGTTLGTSSSVSNSRVHLLKRSPLKPRNHGHYIKIKCPSALY